MKYIQEIEKFIQVMSKENEVPEFFTDALLKFNERIENSSLKKVGIIGDSYYSLYVRAYGLMPVLLSGGSYYTGENTGHIFPQISDPIAKSSIGLLLDPELDLLRSLDAVLIVIKNDSYKKATAYLKDMGIKVIQVETNPYLVEKVPFNFYKQQLIVLNEISKLKLGLFNEKIFTYELKAFESAYEIINSDKWNALSTTAQSLLIYALHATDNKEEWCDEAEKYLESFEGKEFEQQVLLMGSEITMPNYKVFQIFNDIGINRFKNECLTLPDYSEIDASSGALSLLGKCLEFQYKNSFSPQTVCAVDKVVFPENTKGIIYYLLKGQVSEAYQAERMEELAIEQGIPFLCIETDYTYTDKEQVRIRIEAFYEMLSSLQNNKVRVTSQGG